MALFAVQRYMGEEEEQEKSIDQEKEILDNIHKQALQRQKKKESSKVEKKLKKKRKFSEEVDEGDPETESVKKKKKKKKVEGVTDLKKDGEKQNKEEQEDKSEKEPDTDSDVDGEDPAVDDIHSNAFTVLGDEEQIKLGKVHRVLPKWLAQPSVITTDLRNMLVPLESVRGLDTEMLQQLEKHNIQSLFPVQAKVIPEILSCVETGHLLGRVGYRPSDICCSAPTGSGKTLTFVLPIVQALKSRVVCRVRALVMLPVRDLAGQVFKVFNTFGSSVGLKVAMLTGQKSISLEQKSIIKLGPQGPCSMVDIIVATPGRMVEHINQTAGLDLSHLRFLVIDEADRVMDEIKHDWLAQVYAAVYSNKSSLGNGMRNVRCRPLHTNTVSAAKLEIPLQKLLFSATLSQNPEKLQQLNLFQPKLFTSVLQPSRHAKLSQEEVTGADGKFIGKYTTPSGLSEYFCRVEVSQKPLALLHLILHLKFKHIVCFTNTLQTTHRLCLLLKTFGVDGVEEYSSQMVSKRRERLLKQFEAGKCKVLVCSDAMARGMDVENVQCVVSYDVPPYLKTYIHRIGRTARAGKVGTAITLLYRRELKWFKQMLAEAGKDTVQDLDVTKSQLKPLMEKYEETLKKLSEIIKAENGKKSKR